MYFEDTQDMDMSKVATFLLVIFLFAVGVVIV